MAIDLEALIAAAAAQGGGALAGAASTVPQVWMGDKAPNPKATPVASHDKFRLYDPTPGKSPTSVDVDTAVLDFQSWNQQQLLELQRKLKKAGIEANTMFELETQWANLVDAASRSWQAFDAGIIDKPQTPWEVLDKLGSMAKGPNGIGGTEPSTVTYTETTNMSDSDARALGEQTFDAALGRAPGAGEMAGLPTSTTSTRTVHTDRDGNQTSTTQQGANLGQLAVEYARSQDDYAEFQAATTYMDAFMSAIGAVV